MYVYPNLDSWADLSNLTASWKWGSKSRTFFFNTPRKVHSIHGHNQNINWVGLDLQLWNFDYKRLLDKPYAKEVIFREQKQSLKCCQPFELLTYIEKGFRSFHTGNTRSVGQRAGKWSSIKLWEWFKPERFEARTCLNTLWL